MPGAGQDPGVCILQGSPARELVHTEAGEPGSGCPPSQQGGCSTHAHWTMPSVDVALPSIPFQPGPLQKCGPVSCSLSSSSSLPRSFQGFRELEYGSSLPKRWESCRGPRTLAADPIVRSCWQCSRCEVEMRVRRDPGRLSCSQDWTPCCAEGAGEGGCTVASELLVKWVMRMGVGNYFGS